MGNLQAMEQDLKILMDKRMGRPRKTPKMIIKHPDLEGLEAFFTAREISIYRIAKAMGLSYSAVYQWFRGTREITESRLAQLRDLKTKVLNWETKNQKVFLGRPCMDYTRTKGSR